MSELVLFVRHDDVQQLRILAVFYQVIRQSVSYFPVSIGSYFLWRYFFSR
jgi:hypothetical protein